MEGPLEETAMIPKGSTVLNAGQDDEMIVEGYTRSIGRTTLTWIGFILSLGFLRLIFYWKPNWYIRCTHVKTSLSSASHVLLKDQYDQEFVETICYLDLGSQPQFKLSSQQENKKGEPTPLSVINHHENTQYNHKDDLDGRKYFVNKKHMYIFSFATETFSKLGNVTQEMTSSELLSCKPLSTSEAAYRLSLYGRNVLEVHVTPIVTLVIRQAVNPFYVFQLFSVILWYTDEYYYYASAIIIMSVVSITITTYTTRKMERALKSTVHQFGSATIRRAEGTITTLPTEVVPGDIIEIPRSGIIMDVDAILLTGNCIVNESMLTGESIPVTKTPLPNPANSTIMYDPKHHAKHTLFCGTHVIQTRFYGDQAITALVIRTGFMTAKGNLIRSIMFPKPVDFRFYRDIYMFMISLAVIAFMGMIYTVVLMVDRQYEAGLVARRVLDIITIAVPPALPAALAVGIVVSQRRLKNQSKIYCIIPSYINIAGSINVVCFDKTGTLTEDGLDMQGVLPCEDAQFTAFVQDTRGMTETAPIKTGMASCHSLTYIDGELSGDPLDLKMFEATGWSLEEVGEETNRYDMIMPTVVKPKTGHSPDSPEVGILRQFTFSSSLQRMSVIVKNLSSPVFEVFTKGSPEMISSLCLEETIPNNFSDRLAEYTRQGYRVIAMAHKELTLSYAKLHRVDRSEVEKNLKFLGLLVMENMLKPETAPVIAELTQSNIRTVMVTGDNMLTAATVAKQCGIIHPGQKIILVAANEVNGERTIGFYTEQSGGKFSEDTTINIEFMDDEVEDFCFALTGWAWSVIQDDHPNLLQRIAVKGAVFARMSPEQKSQLVEVLQSLDYYVAMCGDGANDCGALKVAHAGISLSEAEASVASPFTSKIANIRCVIHLIKEGRAALVTSFGVFKFMAGYSLTQYASVLLLYYIGANLTDFEFLYIDLAVITSLSITFPFTPAADTLHPYSPPVKLASLFPILILGINFIIMTCVQLGAMLLIMAQQWFEPYEENPDEEYICYENTAVFDVSSFQYIILALMFAQGAPYRKHMFSNIPFLVNVIVVILINVWLTLYPTAPVAAFMELRLPPTIGFRALFLAFAAGNFLICMVVERLITGNESLRVKVEEFAKSRSCCHSGSKYEAIGDEITDSKNWPPIASSDETFATVLHREMSQID
ncbi:polyamine-transporting ATPase 13A3-like [Watersipora subatra]|uniref:polyamine-transporting ATPase 13A3-like n=1 Tax=Watersipora subatra TaxID=2589382 RepID=UPI00355C1777